jgi:hypothetical protein
MVALTEVLQSEALLPRASLKQETIASRGEYDLHAHHALPPAPQECQAESQALATVPSEF